MKNSLGGLLALIVTLAVLTGCESSNTLDTKFVEGTVTLDGVPVEGATVDFIPTDNVAGAAATGMTDAEGHYTLTVLDPPDDRIVDVGTGTLPGEYYVTVRKATVAPTPENSSRPTMGKKSYIVPKKYENARTSGLKATVSEGNNDVDFAL